MLRNSIHGFVDIMSGFSDIDLILKILSYVDARDIARCQQVSRLFRDIIRDSVLLQYKIECHIAGVVDGPNASSDVADRLSRLRRWRAARETLSWTDISEKKYTQFDEDTWFTCKTFGPVFCEHAGTSLTIVRPPSEPRGIRAKEWRFKLPFEPLAYACDYSQHLLALVEQIDPERENGWKIHLKSFLTDTAHPSASLEDLRAEFRPPGIEYDKSNERYDAPEDEDEVEYLLEVQVVGSLLSLTCQVFVPEMLEFCSEVWVWNWTTGELLLNFAKVLKDGIDKRSYYPLLDDEHILLPVEHSGEWHPGPLGLNGVAIVPVHLGCAKRLPYEQVLSSAHYVLALPPLEPRVFGGDVRLSFAPVSAADDPWDTDTVFGCDPGCTLLGIVLQTDVFSSFSGGPTPFTFLVPAAVLTEYTQARVHDGSGPTIVPWTRWGRHAYVTAAREGWYGGAVAATWYLQEARTRQRTSSMALLDFARRPALLAPTAPLAQRDGKPAPDGGAATEIVLEPTLLKGQDRFVVPLVSTLPHRRHNDVFALKQGTDRVLLGDHYAVVYKSNIRARGRTPAPSRRTVYSI